MTNNQQQQQQQQPQQQPQPEQLHDDQPGDDHKLQLQQQLQGQGQGQGQQSHRQHGHARYTTATNEITLVQDARQIRALTMKSLTLQWRQWKTNLFQLLLPILVCAFLFILQLVFNFIQESNMDEAQKNGVWMNPSSMSLNNAIFYASSLYQAGNLSIISPLKFVYLHDSNKVADSVLGNLKNDGTSDYPNSFLARGNLFQLPVKLSDGLTTVRAPYLERVKSQQEINEYIFDELGAVGGKENITFAGLYQIDRLSIPSIAAEPGVQVPALHYTMQYDNRSTTQFCGVLRSLGGVHCRNILSSGMMNNMNSLYAYFVTGGHQMIQTTVKQMPYLSKSKPMALIDMLGTFFFPMVLTLQLPAMLYTIVLEKQHKLRVMMELAGLKQRNYFLVTYAFLLALYLIAAVEFVILGIAFGFGFITGTNFFITFLVLLGWGLSLTSFSFLISAFIGSTVVANLLGFLLVLLSPTFTVIFDQIVMVRDSWVHKLILLYSPMGLTHFLSEAVNQCSKMQCLPISALWTNMQVYTPIIAFYLTAVVYFVLAIYLDRVLPQVWGVRRHPLFFLDPILRPLAKLIRSKLSKRSAEKHVDVGHQEGMDDDVLEERRRVLDGEFTPENSGLLLDKLVKRYGRNKLAVKGISLGFPKIGCLGLLGPNGAGKTTTISMLCGLFGQTSGNAWVNGFNTRTEMDKVHLSLGLCPQFDILWPQLTCKEHILFYARLKGVPIKEEQKIAEELLHAVGLSRKILNRSPQAGSLSGGMKRRLSIAISLVGNPAVVLLDEPTTGLDPKTKRHLWKVILRAKQERCVLLTTHSLVEADVLSDRIAIFSRGSLKAVGASQHLKNKFGSGYRLSITFDPASKDSACSYIESMYPKATREIDYASTVTFEIPREGFRISDLFERIEHDKDEVGIREFGLNQTTLEDVFMSLVKQDVEQDELAQQAKKEAKKRRGVLRGKSSRRSVSPNPSPSQHYNTDIDLPV